MHRKETNNGISWRTINKTTEKVKLDIWTIAEFPITQPKINSITITNTI